ncbi:MAG: class I SAM-dependent methyltransferase [Bacteroidales bacterium]|nr:class I SAM-dependent methyltransferase [Bacteroidales bacterium]
MERKRRLDSTNSRTANYTCMCRAASYMEKDPFFISGDYIAVKLLPKFIKFLVKIKLLNLKGRISPKGIYQYVIARTKYIDQVFINAVNNGIQQVVIMGAGFDSRAIRLLNSNRDVKVYETDTFFTMNAKIKQYRKRKIKKPEHDIFIAVDFEKESIWDKLKEYGYNKERKALFILEGLTMYLPEGVIDFTFKEIYNNSAPGSLIVFDHIHGSVLRCERKYYGEEAIYVRVKKDNEKWVFGIEEGQIEKFLNSYPFSLVEHLDYNELEKKYFKNKSGKIVTRINGTHCIALAKKE